MTFALVTDLDGSFATVEQNANPRYRGRPLGVTPVLTDSSCIVASSKEAKRLGIRCGTGVGEARRICPEIVIVQATPGLYASFHKAILQVLGNVIRVDAAPNIDEFRFCLKGGEAEPACAREIVREMKRRLVQEIGPVVTMTAGVAPNTFLAKLATEMQKDDGFTYLGLEDLPHALNRFSQLTDITGINTRMKVRLNAHGIFTPADLTAASKDELHRIWGSIIGERWWYLLRGHDVQESPTHPGSLGHSHVLPRELRNREGVKAIALRLLGKAAARLRAEGYWASGLWVSVSGRESWERHQRIPETQDDRDLAPLVSRWLDGADYSWPLKVGVNFYSFRRREAFTPSLFADEPQWGGRDPEQEPHEPNLFGAAIDSVNNAWGKHKVYVARIDGVRNNAEEKIAFGKKSLFCEGRGDDLPPWNGIIPLSPLQRLEREVQAGEVLIDLAAYLRGTPSGDAQGDLEETAFRLIGEHLAATLAEPGIVHRAELRRLVVRILRRIGYRQREAEIAAEMVFRDAETPRIEELAEPFSDES